MYNFLKSIYEKVADTWSPFIEGICCYFMSCFSPQAKFLGPALELGMRTIACWSLRDPRPPAVAAQWGAGAVASGLLSVFCSGWKLHLLSGHRWLGLRDFQWPCAQGNASVLRPSWVRGRRTLPLGCSLPERLLDTRLGAGWGNGYLWTRNWATRGPCCWFHRPGVVFVSLNWAWGGKAAGLSSHTTDWQTLFWVLVDFLEKKKCLYLLRAIRTISRDLKWLVFRVVFTSFTEEGPAELLS